MEQVALNKEDVVTVYAQGHWAPRTQACKYAGPKGLDIYVTSNQVEHVYNPNAPTLLHNIYLYKDLNDIAYGTTYNPLHWVSKLIHFGGNHYYNIYGTSCVPHNLFTEDNVAGPEDVAQYVIAVRACIKENPEKKVVLFGSSRGASMVLIALTKLSQEDRKKIKLVIVEAPFATLPSVLHRSYPTFVANCMLMCLENCTRYDTHQVSPLEAVKSEAFPLDLPLLFVTSKVDKTVPQEETNDLIRTLRERNHSELHHLELSHSSHSQMSLQDERDIELYLAKVESLYRKYL